MGLIQNKVTVSQPNSHVVVKNAGGLRGLTGEIGPQGPQGVPGEAATITAGTTTTLPAGSDATVQNVGSTSAAIFNFGIPKGDKGDTGESGAAATISVGSTSTLPAGSSATVTNSGTSSAAVFDFGIPKGDKGDTGATGADGYSPSATVTKTGDTATITITDKDGTTTASISDGSTPTVNDGTLTIQKNGTTVQTFSADQASNVTANITVPTQFSELSGTVSSSQIEDEAITTGSVSGTGTNITLAGTMEGGAIESVEMYGDTTQTTYSGKNLLPPIPDGTYTRNGVTLTVSNGILSFSGTCSGSSDWYLTLSKDVVLSASTYTRSENRSQQVSLNTNLATEGAAWSFNVGYNGNARTQTLSATTTIHFYVLSIVNGANYSGLTIKPQLEAGSPATSFEPYVGGTASPNPDYPQNVNVVTGEQSIEVHAKNLFNVSLYDGITQNVDGTVKSTKYYTTTTAVSLHLEPSTRYTISIRNSNGELNGQGWGVAVNGTWINTTSGTGAVTTDANGDVTLTVGASSYGAIGGYNAFFQLEKGSSATTYEPYKGVTKTVNLGKNLFDTEQAVTKFENSAGATVVSWGSYSDGVVTITRSNGAYGATLFAGFIPRLIEGETYTLSATVRLSGTATGTGLRIGTNDTTPVYITLASKDTWIDASFTFTATAQVAADPRICINANNTGNIVEIKNIQLERGSTATTYAPYFTPIELCKIGTYQDYIYKSGDDWYVHKAIGEVDLDGTTEGTWTYVNDTGHERFIVNYSDVAIQSPYAANTPKIQFSNYFEGSNGYHTYTGDMNNIISGHHNNHQIIIRATQFTSLAAFTSWLGTNRPSVYYVKTTATDIQITNADLIAQLEDLLSATTYSGTTYITVSGDLASPLEVVAEADSKLAPDSVYGAAIKDGAVSVDKIADLKALADALAPYLNS